MESKDEQITKYVKDRDEAIIKCLKEDSLEPLKVFTAKYQILGFVIQLNPPDEVLEIAVRKMAYHSTNIPQELRDKAEKWLIDHGSSTDLD